MIVCEESFRGINPNDSNYANYDIDFYAWIPLTLSFAKIAGTKFMLKQTDP